MKFRAIAHDAWIAKARLIYHEIQISNVSRDGVEFEGISFSEHMI